MKAGEENVSQHWDAFHSNGSAIAKDRLLIHYVALVQLLAGRLKVTLPSSVQMDDLTSCGVLGLIRAIENFDPKRGFKFETYAVPVIRGAMLDGLREYDWLPRTQRVKNRRIEVAIRELERRLSRSPEDEEIASELGLTDEQYQQLLSEAGAGVLVSLDNEVSTSDNSSGSFHDVISDDSADSPLDEIELSEIHEITRKLLTELPDQHRKVMALYYFEELTLKEIGQLMHITESRVCQIHSRVILQLRARIAAIFGSEPDGETIEATVKRPRGRPKKTIAPTEVLKEKVPAELSP